MLSHHERLHWAHASELCRKLAEADSLEVAAMGRTPENALAYATTITNSQAVIDTQGRTCGAFGWTPAGAIWSLWSPLTRPEIRQVIKHTPRLVRQMVEEHGGPLANFIWEGNHMGRHWLKASKCFNVDSHLKEFGGKAFLYFQTKPLEELPL